MVELRHEQWTGTTYGNGFMHRWLIKMLKVINVRILYAFTSIFVIPPTIIINGKARKSIYRFYRDGFGYSKLKSFAMTYCNHCEFSKVVIDRFAMYAGKKFDIKINGFSHYKKLICAEQGFVQLSSHTGNYEIAGYSLNPYPKKLNALVFGGEKESVMANRDKLFGSNNISMIPLSSDMSHLFTINGALADGEIVSMPADRVFGSQKVYEIDFLGRKARFPQGPFLLAASRGVSSVYISVYKTRATEYSIDVMPIETPESGNIREKALKLAQKYVVMLEKTVRSHPAQWYNYFDFWASGNRDVS